MCLIVYDDNIAPIRRTITECDTSVRPMATAPNIPAAVAPAGVTMK
jgi:hypothetical protein